MLPQLKGITSQLLYDISCNIFKFVSCLRVGRQFKSNPGFGAGCLLLLDHHGKQQRTIYGILAFGDAKQELQDL
jgi:hypothetical protein